MFESMIQNVSSTAKSMPANVVQTASTAAASVTSAAAKVRDMQIDFTGLDAARLAKFDPRQLASNLPKVEFPKVDLPKIDLPKVEFPKVELPKVELPKVELPKVEFPKVELPKVELPDAVGSVDVDRVVSVARDVAYAGLGAAVIAAQQVDSTVRRAAARVA